MSANFGHLIAQAVLQQVQMTDRQSQTQSLKPRFSDVVAGFSHLECFCRLVLHFSAAAAAAAVTE